MSQVQIPIASMSVPEMLGAYNMLATERGVPPLRAWHDTRCKLGERVAILRTRPVVAMTPQHITRTRRAEARANTRSQPKRDAILEALAFVTHFEDTKTGKVVSKRTARKRDRKTLLSVGLSYDAILERLRRRCPSCKASAPTLWWTAAMARRRAPGFEKCTLPQKRPHGIKDK